MSDSMCILDTSRYIYALHCCLFFPQFLEDRLCLIENGIITVMDPGRYKWNFSLVSLGEYFKDLECLGQVPGGFWNPIENLFAIKRGTLRHLVSKNGRAFVREVSKDYEKILTILRNKEL